MNKHQETVRLVQAHLAVYITDLMRPRSSDWSTTRPLSGGGGLLGSRGGLRTASHLCSEILLQTRTKQ